MLGLLSSSRISARAGAGVLGRPFGVIPALGLTDATMPTEDQVRTANRGLFAACLEKRADAVAAAVVGGGAFGAGFDVRREAVGRKGLEYQPVELAHPWMRLLRRPNPNRPAEEVWKWAGLSFDLHGSADFVVEDDARGVPVALHEIYRAFGHLAPVPSADGGVDGYVFHRHDGQMIPLAPRDVVRVKRADPWTPFETQSLIERMAYELDKRLYHDVYVRDQLREGRYPPVYLASDQDVSETQAARYGQEFLAKYGRPGQVKGVPVLGKGLEMKQTPLDAEALGLIDLANLSDKQIFFGTGVPQGMVDMEANRANTFGALATFAQLTVQPLAIAFASQLTFALARAFAREGAPPVEGLRVFCGNVVPVDRVEQTAIDVQRVGAGLATRNEVRERDGEDTLGPDGDVPTVPMSLASLAEVVKEPEPMPAPLAGGNGSADDEGPPNPPEPRSSAERAAQQGADRGGDFTTVDSLRLFGSLRRRGVELTEDEIAFEWRAVDRRKRRAEAGVEEAAKGYLTSIGREVAKKIRELYGRSGSLRSAGVQARAVKEVSTDAVFDLARWIAELEAELGPSLASAIRQGFTTGALRVSADLTFDASRPAVRRALAETLDRAKSVPSTVRGAVEAAILEGQAAGLSVEAVAERVQAAVEGMADWKARQIAQTSGTACFGAGQQESYVEAGVERKRWLSQRDGNVRASHDAMDGEEVDVDEPFSNGAMYPGGTGDPAEDVNCRCDTLPILKGEKAAPERAAPERNAGRNAYIRSEYERRVRQGGELRDVVIGELAVDSEVNLSPRQVRRIVDGS